jgi:hypothetical protein
MPVSMATLRLDASSGWRLLLTGVPEPAIHVTEPKA